MNETTKETIIDTIIHDLEALDFNSKEARDVVSKALDEISSQKDLELKEIVENLTYYHNDIAVTEIDWGVDYIRVDDLLAKLTKE